MNFKAVFTAICFLVSTQGFADGSVSGTVNTPGVQIQVQGKGKFVCAASYDLVTEKIYLARSATKQGAMTLAMNECIKENAHGIFCDEVACEQDRSKKSSKIDVIFDVEKDLAGVNISFVGGKSYFECVGKNTISKKGYVSQAPTQLEARALVVNECAKDANDSFCSDMEEVICSSIGSSGTISVSDILDIFKK